MTPRVTRCPLSCGPHPPAGGSVAHGGDADELLAGDADPAGDEGHGGGGAAPVARGLQSAIRDVIWVIERNLP